MYNTFTILSLSFLQNGQTPLWLACLNGHTDIAKLLIENGASMDVKDSVSCCLYNCIIHELYYSGQNKDLFLVSTMATQ